MHLAGDRWHAIRPPHGQRSQATRRLYVHGRVEGDKLRSLMKNTRITLTTDTLNLVAAVSMGIGAVLGEFPPEPWKSNQFHAVNQVFNSFRHFSFDRYMLQGVIVLVLLSLIPKKISKWGSRFSNANIRISGMPLSILLAIASLIIIHPPVTLMFIPILLGFLILLTTSLIPFFSEDGRARVISTYDRLGLAAPTLFAAIVALCAVILFSWMSLVLSVRGWASISGTDGSKTGGIGFYIVAFGYETAKAVPVIDLTDAFGWHPPYNHFGFMAGILIVLFRITVLSPIIGFYGAYWSHMRKRRQSGSKQEEAIVNAEGPGEEVIKDALAPSAPSEPRVNHSRQYPELN